MPRRVKGLTALQISRLGPGYHADGGNLYLVVKEGSRSWVFRYTAPNGARRQMGLGAADVVGLAKARERALAARVLLADGIDPLDQRRAQKNTTRTAAKKDAMTFRLAAQNYIAAHRAGWKNEKHAAQWEATLANYAYPRLGSRPVHEIDVNAILAVLQPIWVAKPETAGRVRGRIEAILDWARVRGFREGENPARWRGNLDHLLPARSKVRTVQHHAALPYPDMPSFMADLVRQEGNAALALQFAILTAARTGEVLGARWEEIDLGSALWVVPASRMKMSREHRVPLSEPALKILNQQKKAGAKPYLFPGLRKALPLSNMALLSVLRRMGRGDITAHGFRSTFRDWVAETTDVPGEVAEAALAHTIDNRVEAAYRRGDLMDKRRALMDAWARFCLPK